MTDLNPTTKALNYVSEASESKQSKRTSGRLRGLIKAIPLGEFTTYKCQACAEPAKGNRKEARLHYKKEHLGVTFMK